MFQRIRLVFVYRCALEIVHGLEIRREFALQSNSTVSRWSERFDQTKPSAARPASKTAIPAGFGPADPAGSRTSPYPQRPANKTNPHDNISMEFRNSHCETAANRPVIGGEAGGRHTAGRMACSFTLRSTSRATSAPDARWAVQEIAFVRRWSINVSTRSSATRFIMRVGSKRLSTTICEIRQRPKKMTPAKTSGNSVTAHFEKLAAEPQLRKQHGCKKAGDDKNI